MRVNTFRFLVLMSACLVMGCDEDPADDTGGGGGNGGDDTGNGEEVDTGTGMPEDTGTGDCEPAFTPREYTFDDGMDGFTVVPDESGDATIPQFVHNPDDGTLELQGDFLLDQMAQIDLAINGADWTCASKLTFMVSTIEAPLTGGGIQPYVMSGGDWFWLSGWINLPTPAEMTAISVELPLVETAAYVPSLIQTMGLQVIPGEGPVHIVVDSAIVE